MNSVALRLKDTGGRKFRPKETRGRIVYEARKKVFETRNKDVPCLIRNGETIGLDIYKILDKNDELEDLREGFKGKKKENELSLYNDRRSKIENKYWEEFTVCNAEKLLELLVKRSILSDPTLNILARSRFYDSRAMKFLECIFHAIVWAGEPRAKVLPWTMRLDKFVQELTDIRDQSSNGIVFFTRMEGSDVPIAMKMAQDTSDEKSVKDIGHEWFVGSQCTNYMRKFVPTFVYVYGSIRCSPAFFDNDNSVSFCRVPGESGTTRYIIYEDLRPAMSYSKFIKYRCNNVTDFLQIFLQVTYALAMAHHLFKFTHYDLHTGNVLIRDPENSLTRLSHSKNDSGETEYYIPFGTEKGVEFMKTKWIAVIIDLGDSYVEFDPKINNFRELEISPDLIKKSEEFGKNFGNTSNYFHGNRYESSYPLHDMHKLFTTAYDKVSEKCPKMLEELKPLFDYFYPNTLKSDRSYILENLDEITYGIPAYEKRLLDISYIQVASKIRCLYDMEDIFVPSSVGLTFATQLLNHKSLEVFKESYMFFSNTDIESIITKVSKNTSQTNFLPKMEDKDFESLMEKNSNKDQGIFALTDSILVIRDQGNKLGYSESRIDNMIEEISSAHNIEKLWKDFVDKQLKATLRLKRLFEGFEGFNFRDAGPRSYKTIYTEKFLNIYTDQTSRIAETTDSFFNQVDKMTKLAKYFVSEFPQFQESDSGKWEGYNSLMTRFIKIVEESSGPYLEASLSFVQDFRQLEAILKKNDREISGILEEKKNRKFFWYSVGPRALNNLLIPMLSINDSKSENIENLVKKVRIRLEI